MIFVICAALYVVVFFLVLAILTYLGEKKIFLSKYKDCSSDDSFHYWFLAVLWPLGITILFVILLVSSIIKVALSFQKLIINLLKTKDKVLDEPKTDYRNVNFK